MPTMTTAEGYNPYGYYPGKKRSAGDYVKRVASMGAWSPDDAAATRANEMRTVATMKTQLEQENAMVKFQTAVEQTAQAVMAAHPDIPKERATQMALEFHYNELAAADAKNKANKAGSEYDEARNRGKTPGAEGLGKAQTAADTSQEVARDVQMQGLAEQERGALPRRRDLGINETERANKEAAAGAVAADSARRQTLADQSLGGPDTRAGRDAATAAATRARADAEAAEARRRGKQAEFDARVFDATAPSTLTTAIQDAETAAAESGARHNILTDRANAEKVARAGINKAGALQVPYGGTAVLPLDDAPVEGQKHPAGPQNTTTITTDQFGNRKTTQRILGDAAPTGGTTATNAYAIDPRMWTNLLNKYIPPTQ